MVYENFRPPFFSSTFFRPPFFSSIFFVTIFFRNNFYVTYFSCCTEIYVHIFTYSSVNFRAASLYKECSFMHKTFFLDFQSVLCISSLYLYLYLYVLFACYSIPLYTQIKDSILEHFCIELSINTGGSGI